MEDIVSIIAIALLLVALVASVRKQRANTAQARADAPVRVGADGAQYERSVRNRADAQQAHIDAEGSAAPDSR